MVGVRAILRMYHSRMKGGAAVKQHWRKLPGRRPGATT